MTIMIENKAYRGSGVIRLVVFLFDTGYYSDNFERNDKLLYSKYMSA